MSRIAPLETLVLALAGLLFAGALPAAAALPPLTDAQAAALQALPADPAPEALTRNSHYWVSNENRLELFEPHIRDRGGVLIGVGTDQDYLFAGWAKSDVLILMDFDQAISELHHVYGIFFAEHATPAAFLEGWSDTHVADVQAKIAAKFAEPGLQKRIQRAYKTARGTVLARLKKVQRHLKKKNVSNFLENQAQYDHVRDLWAKRRVVALRGDLTANGTMLAIGKLIKEQGWTLGVFYPSNAEQYFDMIPQYRANIQGLPASEKSLVIRTMGWGTQYGRADETYHYNVQPMTNFQAWTKDPKVGSSGRMLRWRTPTDIHGFSTFDKLPGAEPTPPVRQKKTPEEDKAPGDAEAAPATP